MSIIAATEITEFSVVSGWCNVCSWVVVYYSYRIQNSARCGRRREEWRGEENAQDSDSRDSAAIRVAIRNPQSAVRSPLFTIPDRRRLLVKAKRQTDFSLSDTLRYEIQQKQKQKQKQWQWQAGQKNANTQKNRGEEN